MVFDVFSDVAQLYHNPKKVFSGAPKGAGAGALENFFLPVNLSRKQKPNIVTHRLYWLDHVV